MLNTSLAFTDWEGKPWQAKIDGQQFLLAHRGDWKGRIERASARALSRLARSSSGANRGTIAALNDNSASSTFGFPHASAHRLEGENNENNTAAALRERNGRPRVLRERHSAGSSSDRSPRRHAPEQPRVGIDRGLRGVRLRHARRRHRHEPAHPGAASHESHGLRRRRRHCLRCDVLLDLRASALAAAPARLIFTRTSASK